MDKPNFRKLSRAELKRYAAGGYLIRPQLETAAKIELDRRNHFIKVLGIIIAALALIVGALKLFDYFPQKLFSPQANPQILDQQKNNDNKTDNGKHFKKQSHKEPPIQNKENKK